MTSQTVNEIMEVYVRSVDRRTGTKHYFWIDGAGLSMTVCVIAIDRADAWELIGRAMRAFMDSQHARPIHSITVAL